MLTAAALVGCWMKRCERGGGVVEGTPIMRRPCRSSTESVTSIITLATHSSALVDGRVPLIALLLLSFYNSSCSLSLLQRFYMFLRDAYKSFLTSSRRFSSTIQHPNLCCTSTSHFLLSIFESTWSECYLHSTFIDAADCHQLSLTYLSFRRYIKSP